MKKTEIQIGTEYVYRHGKHSMAQRVVVLGHTTVKSTTYGPAIPAVEVQVLGVQTGEPADRVPFAVANRKIVSTWEQHLADLVRWEVEQRARDEADAKYYAEQAALNAPVIKAIKAIPGLNQSGFSGLYVSEYELEKFEEGKSSSLTLSSKILAALLEVKV